MTIIPVYNMLLVPKANLYFQTEHFKNLSKKDPMYRDKVVLLPLKENVSREDFTDESFYPIGLTGVIEEVSGDGYVIIETVERVDFNDIHVSDDGSLSLECKLRSSIQDEDLQDEETRLQKVKDAITEFVSGYQWGEMVKTYLNQQSTIAQVGGVMSVWLTISNEERYAILAEDSEKKRNELIEKAIYEYLAEAEVQYDASAAQQTDYKNMYRESAIKKQMEYLQKELDKMHPENLTDIRKFEMKISEIGMNEQAEKEATKVLNRMKQEGQQSQEYGMLYDYLDFVTSLSWKAPEAQFIDLSEAEKVLDEDHYGLKKVKKRIIQQIAVMNLKKVQSGSILLFVGAPGTGKTSIGKSIARALNRKYVRVSLGGVRDEADIRGHRRTYVGSMPGRIMDGISKSGVSNPVMVLDEVDKLASSYHGDPASALLEVLDPEQNNTFTDHYMNVPYDLSNVMFICTANTTDTIPEPLLNRMEVIQFTGYTPKEKFSIATEHLLPKSMESMGIMKEKLDVSPDAIRMIINDYTMESGVRGLRKRIDTLCRASAVMLSKGEEKVEVLPEKVREMLDAHPIHHDKVLSEKRPGVVTGLAWTSAGGDILYIETLFTKGDGKVIITGKLGDVMKESAQIAVSLVKSMFPDKADLFKENDIHIHVPDGAVPKDGPSAGITLTTALASLVTGNEADRYTAMTGEVALRGAVTPIGGLPEKLMAADRAGIKRVLIPKENMDDLDDVAEEVKKRLEIVPIQRVEEVLDLLKITDGEKDSSLAQAG
ncbi:MAG: endopeptidase La [Lachnospiraceae bacterium]|nr:endopeptidase La [Lachnospiraceae bacterium]